MDCHEALMARRRKKTTRNTAQRSKPSTNNAVHLDKSLPAIPPPEARKTAYIPGSEAAFADAFSSPTTDVPSVSKTMGELHRDVDSRPSTAEQQNAPRGKPGDISRPSVVSDRIL